MFGEIVEEIYEEIIQAFLKKLENKEYKNDIEYIYLQEIIAMYKEHFKNRGIYG